MQRYTVKTFDKQFPNDDACLGYIFQARWPEGVTCIKCEKVTKHFRIQGRKVFSCDLCGTHVSPTAGTIFHKSPTPLRSWFHAMFLMASTRCGISAKQLERELGVTYKTAWRMFHQIRKLMEEGGPTFTGPVEADETYIGGKRPGKRGRGAAGKTPTFGMVQREGSVMVKVVPNVRARTLLPIIWKNVPAHEGHTIYTDELASYGLLPKMGYDHKAIRHSTKVWVQGDVHTNTIEGFWSLLKRGLTGVYHSVSPQHLQAYLNEYSFRYNHRKDTDPMFQTLMDRVPAVVAPSAGMPA